MVTLPLSVEECCMSMAREVFVLIVMVTVAWLVVWAVWATRRRNAGAAVCKPHPIDDDDVDDEQLLY